MIPISPSRTATRCELRGTSSKLYQRVDGLLRQLANPNLPDVPTNFPFRVESGLAAGEIVDHFGYSAAFLTLGAAALVAVIVFFLQMPETAEPETTEQETVLPKS